MRIYAAVIFGLSLILTGCPDNPEKSDPATSMEDTSTSTMTTEMELPENKADGMEKMDDMEKTPDQTDTK